MCYGMCERLFLEGRDQEREVGYSGEFALLDKVSLLVRLSVDIAVFLLYVTCGNTVFVYCTCKRRKKCRGQR